MRIIPIHNRFKDNVALITGACGGIGQEIAKLLSQQGADLLLTDQSEAQLLTIKSALAASGQRIEILAGNLLDKAYCDQLPIAAQSLFGRLDIVINNAGIIRRGAITEATDEDYDLSMAINVEAPFRICRAAIKLMAKSGGGAIVNTASCWGLYPGPNHPIYCMSKSALATMTKCLAQDHAHQNIRINAVCPNEVNTSMLRTGFSIRGMDPDTAIEALNQSVPLGRIAEPEEIARVITFLASEESSYVCGACIEINGAKPVY